MKILVIGSSLYEITSVINENIVEGETKRLENRQENGAGVAGNIAYLLGKWGIETYIASMLGADDFATRIKKEFENVGVKIDYIETSYDKNTGESLVLVNNTTKENTIFNVLSNAYLKKYSFAIEPNIIVADGNDYNATVAAFDKYSKASSYLIIKNFNEQTLELCKYANYLIFNKKSAEAFTKTQINFNDSSTLVNVYNKIKQKYPSSEILITLGERGSIYSINSNVKIMPAVRLELVDPNGAGEVYAGAFIYGMAREFGLEKSIAYATIASSMSITKLTSRMSIPTLTEVSTYYDGKFGAANNPNKETPKFKDEKPNMNTSEVIEANIYQGEIPNNQQQPINNMDSNAQPQVANPNVANHPQVNTYQNPVQTNNPVVDGNNAS